MALEMPLRRVLLATDFSASAERAAARVACLPLGDGAEVRLLHVVPSVAAGAKAQVVARARHALQGARDELMEKVHATVLTEIVEGEPFVEIVRAARRHGCQLIVLGRHSKKGRAWRLGTTAERVARKGSTPVLVVRLAAAGPYGSPVVAVDLSDVSRAVLDLAQLVLGVEQPLRLVHAYHVPFEGMTRLSVSRDEVRSWRAEFRDMARAQMRELLSDVGAGARGWQTTVQEGDPRIVLIHELEKRAADVVVLGTHGRSGLSHFLLGSAAEWVLHEAPCDVLIGRPARFTFELP